MSKLINIADKTYEKLKQMKGENKSFTIVIDTLIERKEKSNKESILACAGKGGIDEKRITELRRGWKAWTEKYA